MLLHLPHEMNKKVTKTNFTATTFSFPEPVAAVAAVGLKPSSSGWWGNCSATVLLASMSSFSKEVRFYYNEPVT